MVIKEQYWDIIGFKTKVTNRDTKKTSNHVST